MVWAGGILDVVDAMSAPPTVLHDKKMWESWFSFLSFPLQSPHHYPLPLSFSFRTVKLTLPALREARSVVLLKEEDGDTKACKRSCGNVDHE